MNERKLQIAGILIALVSLVITGVQILTPQRLEPKTLQFQHAWSYNPLFCNGEVPQLSLKIDKFESNRVRIHYFWITNTGHRAVRPEDFSGPIRLSLDGDEKVIAVLNTKTKVSGLSVKNGEVEIAPRLINPEKVLDFLVATETSAPCSSEGKATKWKWDAEIADTFIDAGEDESNSPSWAGPLGIMVYLTGFNVWIALGAAFAFFFLTIEIVRREWPRAFRHWLAIAPVFLLSVANGENAASLLQDDTNMWAPALVAFGIHVVLLLSYFLYRGFRILFRQAPL